MAFRGGHYQSWKRFSSTSSVCLSALPDSGSTRLPKKQSIDIAQSSGGAAATIMPGDQIVGLHRLPNGYDFIFSIFGSGKSVTGQEQKSRRKQIRQASQYEASSVSINNLARTHWNAPAVIWNNSQPQPLDEAAGYFALLRRQQQTLYALPSVPSARNLEDDLVPGIATAETPSLLSYSRLNRGGQTANSSKRW